MQYRSLGASGLQVSEIGFGCSRIGGIFAKGGSVDEAMRALHGALAAGITFYDTADIYAQGESEALLGRAFQGRREHVLIASKAGYCLPGQRKLIARIKPLVRPLVRALGIKRASLPAGVTGELSQDFSHAYLTRAVEGSLRRLRTDYLDLFQLHSPPAAIIESGDFLLTLETLQQQGKIRCFGIAADCVEDAQRCLRYPQLAAIQLPLGLLDPEALASFLSAASALHIGVIGRGCFGGGLLKESLTETELRELTTKWRQILAYRRLAGERQRHILEMALQFTLHAPAVSTVLVGMHKESQLIDNLRHYSAAPLTESEYAAITAIHAGL